MSFAQTCMLFFLIFFCSATRSAGGCAPLASSAREACDANVSLGGAVGSDAAGCCWATSLPSGLFPESTSWASPTADGPLPQSPHESSSSSMQCDPPGKVAAACAATLAGSGAFVGTVIASSTATDIGAAVPKRSARRRRRAASSSVTTPSAASMVRCFFDGGAAPTGSNVVAGAAGGRFARNAVLVGSDVASAAPLCAGVVMATLSTLEAAVTEWPRLVGTSSPPSGLPVAASPGPSASQAPQVSSSSSSSSARLSKAHACG
mmetsp:Transcript_44563/g.142007  ORF Transcript_44563/g.142007 Transcript_44563/m.142007 type:complete len:263 (-) Transcript_44563:1397-2185(-)